MHLSQETKNKRKQIKEHSKQYTKIETIKENVDRFDYKIYF